ncbi:MAG: GNAT family N-acetyltransferase [Duodenibacillus sp.]|nr:GNAT family N-acetyltransferase [Duodenibacillus sp.]
MQGDRPLIRPYRAGDDDASLEQAICRAWSLDLPDPATEALIGRYYLHDTLSRSTATFVAEIEGRARGLVACALEGAHRGLHPRHCDVAQAAWLALQDRPDGLYALSLFAALDAVDAELIAQAPAFDAEVTLFFLDKAYQGRGAGGALWEQAMAWLAGQGAESYYLFTDTSCSWRFYERKGLELYASRKASIFAPEDDGETFFIFGTRLHR